MSLLSRTRQQKAVTNIPAPNGVNIQLINGRLIGYEDNLKTYIDRGYNVNDIVYSIINIILDKVRVAPFNVYKIVDEKAYIKMHAMQQKKDWSIKDYSTFCNLQNKALEIVPQAGKWSDLLKYPNSQETFSDFIVSACGYQLLTGNTYTWANVLKGGVNAGVPNELWNLPSQYMNIFGSNTYPTMPIGYWLTVLPQAKYTVDEVMHLKYWNPNYDINGTQLYGQAPLRAALKRLKKSNSLIDAEASSFQNEGIKGIAYMQNQVGQVDGDQTAIEVGKLAETMRNQWSGTENRGRIGLSGYTMGWLPIGLSSEEMQMIESGVMDIRMLCNVFGVQSQLLNDPANKTYNNQEEAEKALTTRAALPLLTRFRDGLNRKASSVWGLPKWQVIDFDMTVYTELQADMKEMTEWMDKLPFLSPNRKLDLLNLEKVDNPIFDEPWITQGMGQPLSEWEMTENENALNEDEEEDS